MKRILPLLSALLALVGCGHSVRTLFVGTYSDGFYAYEFDEVTGKVVSEGDYPEAPGAYAKASMPNPSYLTVDGNRVYAVSEMPDSTAAVYAWRFGGNGFECLSRELTLGADPCYVSTNGRLLAVANYSGGSLAVFKVTPQGITPIDSLLVSSVGGPDLSRQQTPHVHCAVFTPDGKHLVFSEFSSDEVGMLDLVPGGGVRNYRRAAFLDADYGPRHILFDASGTHLYVIGELSGDIRLFDYEAGKLQRRQVIQADRAEARGAADIHLSPDGKFLYASLRLQNDGIAIFSVAEDGTLTEVGYQQTGIHPRHFNITPDGRWLLCCCRDEDAVEIYRRDPKTGLLTDTGGRIRVARPVCVTW